METKSLIDQIEFSCKNWIDPEETGIKGYVLYAKEIADSKAKPLLRIPQFDPTSPAMIRLALGTYDFLAEIEDAWGAKTEYIIAQSVSIIEPTIQERIEFEDSGIKEDIKGSGDSKMMMMILTAEGSLGPLIRPPEEGEEEQISPENAAVAAGQAKINALENLLDSGAGAVSDPDSALIMVNTIGSVVGPSGGEGPSSVGLEVGTKAVAATEVRLLLGAYYNPTFRISLTHCLIWMSQLQVPCCRQ